LGHEIYQWFKIFDFTMLRRKENAANHCRQNDGKRVGKVNEIIVI
jgi:hypothetical protein